VSQSLQERYAPGNICFGCGPANPKGLRIRSFVLGEEVVCDWTPELHHQAFEGVLNGGIIGALMDCHSNWAATHHLMQKSGADTPPSTVTAEYAVKMLRPTPSGQPLRLRARVIESTADRATVEAVIESGDKVCATCRGVFVAVQPGHPPTTAGSRGSAARGGQWATAGPGTHGRLEALAQPGRQRHGLPAPHVHRHGNVAGPEHRVAADRALVAHVDGRAAHPLDPTRSRRVAVADRRQELDLQLDRGKPIPSR